MKILFTLTNAFDPNAGGVQRTTYKLGRKFTEMQHQVFYYSGSHDKNKPADFGTLYYADQAGNVENPVNIQQLRTILHEVKPDFVINQMPYRQPLSQLLYEEKSELKYILLGCLRNSLFSVKNNIRDTSKSLLPASVFKLFDNRIGLSILLYAHKLKHRKQLKKILDLHDKYILLTPANIKELHYFVKDYKADKVCVVPNSIPKVYFEDLKKEKIILFVGSLKIEQKRADLLIEFWKRTCHKLEDWKFVVLGDGDYKSKMDEIVLREKLPRIELLGNQKPEEWYKKSPIFVKTSAYEGFPNVILEAQSYGCVPVTFSSYDAISGIVNDQEDAILVPPFDTDKMSEEVVSLATGKYDLAQMGIAAKKNISKFVIDAVYDQWMDLFNRMKDQ